MLTADTITDDQIRELRDRACECRNIDGFGPRIGAPDDHAAVHDCDVEIYDDCVRALGQAMVLAPGSALDPAHGTWVPSEERGAARARCAEILQAREAREARDAPNATPAKIDLCPACGRPGHAGETDDLGRHPRCAELAELNVLEVERTAVRMRLAQLNAEICAHPGWKWRYLDISRGPESST